MKNCNGFSLIEIIVVTGLLSVLVTSAFFIGLPEYNRYILSAEREYLIDTLLESRARALVSGSFFVVSIWSNGYCIKDVSSLCVVPIHDLPANIVLTSIDSSTSTKMLLAFTDDVSKTVTDNTKVNALVAEINIDKYGFIDER